VFNFHDYICTTNNFFLEKSNCAHFKPVKAGDVSPTLANFAFPRLRGKDDTPRVSALLHGDLVFVRALRGVHGQPLDAQGGLFVVWTMY
jgi:hypothetical protein